MFCVSVKYNLHSFYRWVEHAGMLKNTHLRHASWMIITRLNLELNLIKQFR